jgi:hypothetical protein
MDGAKAEVEAGLAPVVVAGAEVNSLGEANVVFDDNGGKIVDPKIFPQPAMVPNSQPPGKFHP